MIPKSLTFALVFLTHAVNLYGQIDFETQVVPLFSNNNACTGCHGALGDLTLTGVSADVVYNEVVNEIGPRGSMRVNTGDPTNSLILVLPSGGSQGGSTHSGGTRTDWGAGESAYNIVLQWIQEGAVVNSVKDPSSPTVVPQNFELEQNYPNPFNPGTAINFRIAQSAIVSLTIYNILGQSVKTLLNELRSPGVYSTQWNGRNERGERVQSGMYFYTMTAGDFKATRKMIVLP